MRKLVVATRNRGKALEVARMVEGLGWEVVSLDEYPDAPEVEEVGSTFAENAAIKAEAYARFTGELTIADDSGLEVDALDGAPGVMSSRFAATDSERNAKLLAMLDDVPDDRRSARFRCAVAIAEPNGRALTCEGSVEGTIAREPKGQHGFGYDPVFYLPDLGRHMAELSPEEKDAVSHRGRALRLARKMLQDSYRGVDD